MSSKVTKVVSYLVRNFPMKIYYIGIIYDSDLSIEESKLPINKIICDILYIDQYLN